MVCALWYMQSLELFVWNKQLFLSECLVLGVAIGQLAVHVGRVLMAGCYYFQTFFPLLGQYIVFPNDFSGEVVL